LSYFISISHFTANFLYHHNAVVLTSTSTDTVHLVDIIKIYKKMIM